MAKTLAGLSFILAVLSVPQQGQAAILYFSPETREVFEQDTLVVEMRVDTEGESINAVDLEVFFPQNVLEVLEVNSGGSIFTLYPRQPDYSNALGDVSVQAGAPKGFMGEGLIARIFFRAESEGEATLRFSRDSKVYLNDGLGTPAEAERREAEFLVSARDGSFLLIQSPEYPDENAWYRESFVQMRWPAKEGASYSYAVTTNAAEAPDEIPEKSVGEAAFMLEEDGIYYFHLRECVEGVCGAVRTRRAMKDGTAPESFPLLLGQEADAYGGKRFVSFIAADAASGIDYFLVRENGGNWAKAENLHVLADDAFEGVLEVKAVDKAGNERIERILVEGTGAGDKNFFIFVGILGTIVGIGAVLLILRWKRIPL